MSIDIVCDRCGAKIGTLSKQEERQIVSITMHEKKLFKDYDMCNACYKAFESWIRNDDETDVSNNQLRDKAQMVHETCRRAMTQP